MNRTSWKCLLVGAVVAVALSSAAPQADAQWWGYSRPAAWGCCYAPRYVAPCYTSCYTPCCTRVAYSPCCYDGGWSLGVRPGPVRRLLLGPYRWYWGGYYWDGGCCTTYEPCCTDSPVTNAAPTQPTPAPTPAKKPVVEPPAAVPAEPTPPVPAPAAPNLGDTSSDRSGTLTVWVPYDAKVTVNGRATSSTGSRRQFISYGLQSGLNYKYVVKAEVVRNGQIVEDTKTVVLTAGQITAVAFGFNTTQAEQVAAR